MSKAMVELTGYHGTCSYSMEKIEKYRLDPGYVRYRDDHWLGQGVYFLQNGTKPCGGLKTSHRKSVTRAVFRLSIRLLYQQRSQKY